MPSSRNNHYVPQWYQESFFEPGSHTLAYLDLSPLGHALPDGRIIPGRSHFNSPTSRCFVQRDLYSTFFGTAVNDEIERRLFGAIDTNGAPAVKAFTATDVSEWHRHFETLFSFLDIQKLRTPKGLDWLRAQYPRLSQNELMEEMQGIRMMNCTIWTEGVREIVSAEGSAIKFIVTDHPVTIYNCAVPPSDQRVAYPHDPSIALKGSQTIFALNRDFCLILTNLEYAKEPSANPLEKRTFARNFRSSMVRTDAFIRKRKLSAEEVVKVNAILKARAKRFIAAGRKEWLHPEAAAPASWRDLGAPLRPPSEELWHFGGEIMARFNDGHVRYQDEFGRSVKPHHALQKTGPVPTRGRGHCGCGSGRAYKHCCESRPAHLRPSWSELSIRERNLALHRAAVDILGLGPERTWVDVRQDITDDKISRLYGVFAAFWPLETDLLQLLPKPDGRPRAVYTGPLHPNLIRDFAVGAALYFGEVLIQHPFIHAGTLRKEYSPVESPRIYRQEVLKAVLLFETLMPLVECGLVNLIPDPCNFDLHLRDQMMRMAKERAALTPSPKQDERIFKVVEADGRRSFMLAPHSYLNATLRKGVPGLEGVETGEMIQAIQEAKLNDPLATLQPGSLAGGESGGQLTIMKMAPNFEMAMYLAQATGAVIVTDSPCRWDELQLVLRRRQMDTHGGLREFASQVERARFIFPQDEFDVARLRFSGSAQMYPDLMRHALKYLVNRDRRGAKPNFERQLASRFMKGHNFAQSAIAKFKPQTANVRIRAAVPASGIQDNTVNRLLLMSSSEHHLSGVPMAFFMEQLRA